MKNLLQILAKKNLLRFIDKLLFFLLIFSCAEDLPTSKKPGKISRATGQPYAKGKFRPQIAKKQHVAPTMVYVEGGSFTMGNALPNLFIKNIKLHNVTVASFWISEVATTNLDWREYINDLYEDMQNEKEENEKEEEEEETQKNPNVTKSGEGEELSDNLQEINEITTGTQEEGKNKLPAELSEGNEIEEKNLGASFNKPKKSAKEIYEAALPDEKVWQENLAFNDSYVKFYFKHPMFNLYPVIGVSYTQIQNFCAWRTKKFNEALFKSNKKLQAQYDFEEDQERLIESGTIALPFRLPTEAEWEYAAIGATVSPGNKKTIFYQQNLFPWEGLSTRETQGKNKGRYRANYKRGRGNYKGLPGQSKKGPGATWEVYQTPTNALGIRIGGNIKEWTADLYREESMQDVEDFNPYRRDDTLDQENKYNTNRSLVNNKVRVIKGASWKDVAFWLSPAQRRFLHEDSCEVDLGFRCAMSSVGEAG